MGWLLVSHHTTPVFEGRGARGGGQSNDRSDESVEFLDSENGVPTSLEFGAEHFEAL